MTDFNLFSPQPGYENFLYDSDLNLLFSPTGQNQESELLFFYILCSYVFSKFVNYFIFLTKHFYLVADCRVNV